MTDRVRSLLFQNGGLTILVKDTLVGQVYLYRAHQDDHQQRSVAVMRMHPCHDKDELYSFFVLETGQGLSKGMMMRVSMGIKLHTVKKAELLLTE